MAKLSSGRTKKFEGQTLHFGMKVTAQEKANIKKLALIYKTTATDAVLKAINKALIEVPQNDVILTDRRITSGELIAMDKKTREKIFREQAKLITKYDEVIEDSFDIIDD